MLAAAATVQPAPSSARQIGGRLLAAVLAWAAIAGPGLSSANASELNVERWRWNLDNTVRLGTFNTLMLEVSNVSGQAFEGILLIRTVEGLQTIDLPQSLYLAAGQRQQVFFDVTVLDTLSPMTVVWGRRADQFLDLGVPTQRPTYETGLLSEYGQKLEAITVPIVAIDDGLAKLPQRSRAIVIDEATFPPSAATLPAEGVLLLDHMPRWQPAQQQAALDFVRLGGQLHLYRRGDRDAVLSGELAAAVSPQVDDAFGQPLGAGLIRRFPTNLAEITPEAIAELAQPEIVDDPPEEDTDEENSNRRYYNPYYASANPSPAMFGGLAYMHRPDINWSLIFSLFGLYIVLLIGGGLLVSRKTRSWQKTYLALLTTVAVFSVLFWQIGARGHGEQSTLSTVAVADVLSPTHARLHAWSDLFLTRRDAVTLRPGGDRAGLRPREQAGRLVGGAEPTLERSVPSFSSVTFEWQAIEPIATPLLLRPTVDADGRNLEFELQLPAGHLQDPTARVNTREVRFVTADGYGVAIRDGARYRCRLDETQPLDSSTIGIDANFEWGGFNRWQGNRRERGESLLQLAYSDLTLAATLGVLKRPVPPGRVDVLLTTTLRESPAEGLKPENTTATGQVLWRVPVWIAGSRAIGSNIQTGPPPELDEIFDALPGDAEAGEASEGGEPAETSAHATTKSNHLSTADCVSLSLASL